jgi:fatty acid desaturase
MSENKTKSTSLGVIIFLIFLVMKLAKIGEVANWSWWWVTAPLWIPIAFILIVLLVFLLIAVIVQK